MTTAGVSDACSIRRRPPIETGLRSGRGKPDCDGVQRELSYASSDIRFTHREQRLGELFAEHHVDGPGLACQTDVDASVNVCDVDRRERVDAVISGLDTGEVLCGLDGMGE